MTSTSLVLVPHRGRSANIASAASSVESLGRARLRPAPHATTLAAPLPAHGVLPDWPALRAGRHRDAPALRCPVDRRHSFAPAATIAGLDHATICPGRSPAGLDVGLL